MKNEYLIALRGRRGLDEDDNSEDEQIIGMSPDSKFKSFVEWHLGDSDWADIMIDAAVDFGLVKKTESSFEKAKRIDDYLDEFHC